MRMPALIALTLFSLSSQAADVQQLTAEGMALIPPFQQQLLGAVKAAMQEGGPAKAVEACNLLAPQITAQNSKEPWKVGRTALKVRNTTNAPDAWERKVLEDFQKRAAAGEDLTTMKHAEVVGNEFRLMKAIPTGEPCLACHGSEIKPELASVIDSKYPQDQARGFKAGELRGAFTLRRPLEEQK